MKKNQVGRKDDKKFTLPKQLRCGRERNVSVVTCESVVTNSLSSYSLTAYI